MTPSLYYFFGLICFLIYALLDHADKANKPAPPPLIERPTITLIPAPEPLPILPVVPREPEPPPPHPVIQQLQRDIALYQELNQFKEKYQDDPVLADLIQRKVEAEKQNILDPQEPL